MASENLHTQLWKWAQNEMKFHTAAQNAQSSFKMPTADDFKFLCSGPLVDVWKHVVKHTTSVQKAKLVKGNVRLKHSLGKSGASFIGKDKSYISEEEEERQQVLGRERAQLLRELQQTSAEIAQLNKELTLALEERSATELAYQCACDDVRNLQRKESLLHTAHGHALDNEARYEEYTQRVEKCIAHIIDKKGGASENFVSSGSVDRELETESCHMVRQSCDDICNFLYQLLDDSAKKEALERHKMDLLGKAERAAAVNSTRSLLSALADNTDSDARRLRQRTAEVDISKDAEEISFTYDPNEGLQDLSKPQSPSDSVEQLLMASSNEHVLRWFKQQQHLNEEWKLTTQHDELLGEINKLLSKHLGEHRSHLALAKSYVAARLQLAEERAVTPCLRREAKHLSEQIDKAQIHKQELKHKASKIHNFQKIVSDKQAVISHLAKINATAPDRLKSHKLQVEEYLESRAVMAQLSEVQALPMQMKGAFISELDLFLEALMPCLLTLQISSHNKMCALDLSTAPAVYPLAFKKMETFVNVCKALELPMHMSVEGLFLHVLDLHASTKMFQTAQKQREATAASATKGDGTSDDIANFIDLRKIADEHDRAQCEKFLPRLKDGIRLVEKHSQDMESLKKSVLAWWEQPAQWTTPWTRSGGLTFKHWVQKFRTLMTQSHSARLTKTGTK